MVQQTVLPRGDGDLHGAEQARGGARWQGFGGPLQDSG